MGKDANDKRFDFVRRHFNGVFDTFNAASAIRRAEQLKEEAAELKVLIAQYDRPHPWQPIEFPGYYIVGLVTCLEWHARSRLHDLLRYDPKNFSVDDIKQAVSINNISEILRNQMTVEQLIAASTLVSDFRKYLDIFDRVLKHIGASTSAEEIAKAGPGDPGKVFLALKTLFERRHHLVHEIDQTQVGHWNLRTTVSLDEAEILGNAVVGLMTRLEESIAAAAEDDFPNLIQQNASRHDRLLNKIIEIESRIIGDMQVADSVGLDINLFKKSVRLSREYLSCESSVLRQMDYPGRRYYSVGEPLIIKLYEVRLAYLTELEKQLHDSSVIAPKTLDPPDDSKVDGPRR